MATKYECYRCGYVSSDRLDFSLNIDMASFTNSGDPLPSINGLCGGCYEQYEMLKSDSMEHIKQWLSKEDPIYTRPEE